MKRCPLCKAQCALLECYRIGDDRAWLCAGCVARARQAGYHVVWIPKRMVTPTDTFIEALILQEAIIEEQSPSFVVRRVA